MDRGPPADHPGLEGTQESSHRDNPDFRLSSLVGFDERPGWPIAWCNNAQSLYDAPLEMHYDGLDPSARYRVRVVYSGDNFRPRVRLEAEGEEIHPLIKKPDPIVSLEFDIPARATSDGALK